MQANQEHLEQVAKDFNLGAGLMTNLLKSDPAVKQAFLATVKLTGLATGQQRIGNMLYSIATKLPNSCQRFREHLAAWIAKGDISHQSHLDCTLEYIKTKQMKGGAELDEVKQVCEVGVKYTNEQIVNNINKNIAEANEKSKKFEFMAKVRQQMPSVEGKLLKDLFEAAWKEKGLPDKVVVEKEKKDKKVEKKQKPEQEQTFQIKDISSLVGREMKSSNNSKEAMKQHQEKFGNAVYTRFPPEPNGYLHIGHCKAMRFDFMLAKVNNGKCYLRFDDTNPTKENREYIDNIKENVEFMGYEPWQVTHSSDNFDLLYEYAVRLIKQGDAFVCSENQQQVKKKRSEGLSSKDRERSVEENLSLFEEMKLGLHEEGSLSLRAKIDYKHPNTTLRDPVIYRIRFHHHPHVGDKWCIYPLYDFTHPLCDSIQGITHSLCSLEFEIRRELYYWPLEKLNLYRAHAWEFSRLNLTYTVLSKRKLHELIFNKHVNGWDDPRLLTINGMRRRGYNAEILNSFCDVIGVSRKGNQNYVQFGVLENEARKYYDIHAPRTMAVLEPIEMVIQGLAEPEVLVAPLFPKDQEKGTRKIKFTKTIYVELSDIKLKDEKGFYGIAPNKVIGLKYAQPVFVKEVKAENGKIVQVIAQIDEKKTKPNSYLNWISTQEAVDCEVRNYGLLFNCQKPGDAADFIKELNPKSIEIMKGAKIHRELWENIKQEDRFQFERKGFYCLDKDTDLVNKKLVFNQIVGLVDRLKK